MSEDDCSRAAARVDVQSCVLHRAEQLLNAEEQAALKGHNAARPIYRWVFHRMWVATGRTKICRALVLPQHLSLITRAHSAILRDAALRDTAAGMKCTLALQPNCHVQERIRCINMPGHTFCGHLIAPMNLYG